jgi:integrase
MRKHLQSQELQVFLRYPISFVIENITPHMLRHTFATLLYFAGVDILTAKEQPCKV